MVLVGPTASGKTGVSLALASLLGAEVISADSMQVYRGFDIGTDKVPRQDRLSVIHHLVDVLDPAEMMDLGGWVRRAREAIVEVRSRGRVPLVVGGTGLYVRGLLKGVFDGPSRRPQLRRALRAAASRRDDGWLHLALRRLDPGAASRVGPRDLVRIVRALEVILSTGRRFSSQAVEWGRRGRMYSCLEVGLRREAAELRSRVDRRVERMYHLGLVDEVRSLLEGGVPRDAHAFQAIGYREALLVALGRSTMEDAIQRTQRASWQYARRQMIWFRKEERIQWIDAAGEPAAVASEVARLYREVLSGGTA